MRVSFFKRFSKLHMKYHGQMNHQLVSLGQKLNPQHAAHQHEIYMDDSDNECPPPPIGSPNHYVAASPLPSPPPPSPPPLQSLRSRSPTSFQNINNKNIAKRFHEYVLLVKCVGRWNEYAVVRRRTIASKKQQLKRIFFKWGAYVDETRSRRKSIAMITRILSAATQRAMHLGMTMLVRNSDQLSIVEKIFMAWEEYTRLARTGRMTKECQVMNRLVLSKTRMYFSKWRMLSILQMVANRTKRCLLRNLFLHWQNEVEKSSRDWILKIEQASVRVNDSRLNLLRKMFKYLVSD